MKRKFLLIFLLIACCGTFFACNNESKVKTLKTPTDLEVENQYISFTEVNNASYYLINYDGNTVVVKPSNTGEIVYNASKIFTESKTYEIKVKAIGEKSYSDSEYSEVVKYTRRQELSAPNIELSGEILTWSLVSGADSYTLEVAYPSGVRKCFTYSTNGFDINSVLYTPGIYKFRVKAGKAGDANEYSGEIEYKFRKKLSTPSNLALALVKDDVYLYMCVDENSSGYVINVNDEQFDLISASDIENYTISTGYRNMVEINLTKLLKNKDYIKDLNDITLSVQAKSSSLNYYTDSDFSSEISLKVKSAVEAPVLAIEKKLNTSVISWGAIDGVSNYVIYKNYEYFCQVSASSPLKMEFENSEIQNDVFTVAGVSSEYCYPSPMSNAVACSITDKGTGSSLQFNNNKLSWGKVSTASGYFLEILNDNFYYSSRLDNVTTSFDLSDFNFGDYTVKLHVVTAEKLPNVITKNITYTKTLGAITNAKIGDATSRYNITFDAVEGAYGYVVHISSGVSEDIDMVFNSNVINLTPYIISSGTYQIKIKALAKPYSNIKDSAWLSLGSLRHAEKLATPELSSASIEEVDGEYILKFAEVPNAQSYKILINYIDVFNGSVDYDIEGYNITSFLTSAQVYTIKVKALAQEGQSNYFDSDYATCSFENWIQLNSIKSEDIKISFDEQNNAYLLDFPTQTHVANYEIRMLWEHENTIDEEKFTITSVPYDMTKKFMGAGVYSIYITAKANNTEGYFYLDASETSNPYVFEKFKATLGQIENVKINIKSNMATMTWNAVDGADAYYVNIYYNAPNGELEQTVSKETVTSNVIDLNGFLQKEGRYRFEIKAVSNGTAYSSAFKDETYNYRMIYEADFARNKTRFGGQEFSHKVESYEQLKNLIWNSYLYHNETYSNDDSGTNPYQLKFIVKQDNASTFINDEIRSEVNKLVDNSSLASEDYKILQALIKLAFSQYGENKGSVNFSLTQSGSVENNYNSYAFYCAPNLEDEKTYSFENKSNTKFEQTSDIIEGLQKRKANYIFKLELSNKKANVSTSEQLFMAVQDGCAPNFVVRGSSAERIYDKAKSILRDICVDSMSDYEKAIAIYNYLINNVEYNYDFDAKLNSSSSLLDTITLNSGDIKLGNFKYEYLEGVFDESGECSATNNGLAKAFVLMCRLEGIEATKVNGTKDGKRYYWNQVKLITPNSELACWYNVDISASYNLAVLNNVTYQLPTHKFFLVTTNFMINELNVSQSGEYADTTFQYLANTNFEFSYNSNTIGGSFKYATTETLDVYMQAVVDYVHYMSSQEVNRWVVVEVDMSATSTDLSTIVSKILGAYSSKSASKFGVCHLACEIVNREDSGDAKTILIYANPN